MVNTNVDNLENSCYSYCRRFGISQTYDASYQIHIREKTGTNFKLFIMLKSGRISEKH